MAALRVVDEEVSAAAINDGRAFTLNEIADRVGATNAGQRAGAIELALEGLYLSRRLSKETGDGAAVYG